MPLHACAAPFAQGMQIRPERRTIPKGRAGLAAAADHAYGIQSKPFLPSVWSMFPICISVWTPFSSMTVFIPPNLGVTVLTSPAAEALLTNYELE